MKKLFSAFMFIVVLLGLLFASATPGLAQDVPPTPEVATPIPPLDSGVLPFSSLGVADLVMRGPFDSADVRYTPPASWQLNPGAALTLSINASFSSSETLDPRSSGAALQIELNNILVTTLFINQPGEQVFNITIPPEALTTTRTDGRHTLSFFLDAAFDCAYPQETTIVVHSNSMIELPHTSISPAADLTILPRPFFQQNSFLPEASILVLPENPTAGEVQAALTVSTAFGRMSSGELSLTVLPTNLLTNEIRDTSHLIFVGDSARFNLLSQVSFTTSGAQPGDGSLQMAISPWNPARAILHVSGSDESGLLKAARALTFGTIQPGADVSTAVISDVNPASTESLVATDRTFADLGYLTRTANSFGVNSIEYRFYMPPGQVPATDPYLNLIFSHSALVDFNNSGLVVVLNDQRISSARFTEETSKQVNTIKVPLHAESLRPGDNRLVIQADLRPTNICSNFSNSGLWFTINAASLVHLPLIPAEVGEGSLLINLSQYPYPFISSPTLSDVGFVLASDDAGSWNIASQLAAGLGRRATGQLLAPQLAFADAITDEFRQNHLIVIGRPSKLALVSEMAEVMPAPFEQGSDLVIERTPPVVYRLPEGTSLGYIELFSSPWNPSRSVMTLLGSSSDGLDWAFNAMTNPSLRGQVTGNYVVVNREQILSTDTRIGTGSAMAATLAPGSQATLPDPLVPTGTVTVSATPTWILPAIIAISILTVGLLVFVAIYSLRQAKK